MAEYRCPAEIVELFKESDDERIEGMRRAGDWVRGLTLERGDVVWLPRHEDGEMQRVVFGERMN